MCLALQLSHIGGRGDLLEALRLSVSNRLSFILKGNSCHLLINGNFLFTIVLVFF